MKINIFDKKNKKFGKLSNNFYLPIEVNNKTWKTVNHYIYSNIVDTPIYKIMIQNSKNPYEAYKSIKQDNYVDNISNIINDYVSHKVNDGEFNFEIDTTEFTYKKFRKELLNTGDKRIIYRSDNSILGIKNGDGLNLIGKIYEKYRLQMQVEIKNKLEVKKKKDKEQLIYKIYNILVIIDELITKNYDIRNLLNLDFQKLSEKINSLQNEYDIGDKFIDISNILNYYNNKVILYYNTIKYSVDHINYIIPIFLKFNIRKLKEKEKEIDKIIFMNYLHDKINRHNPSLTEKEHDQIISQHLSKLNDRQYALLKKKISNYYQQNLIQFSNLDIENDMIKKIEEIKLLIPTDNEINNFEKISINQLEISNDILCNIDNFKTGLYNNNISFDEEEIEEIFKNPLSTDSKYSPTFLKNICESGANNTVLTSQFEDTYSKEEIDSAINYAKNKVDGKEYPKPLIKYVQRYLNRLPPKIDKDVEPENQSDNKLESNKDKFFENLKLTPQKIEKIEAPDVFNTDDNIFNIKVDDYLSPLYKEPVFIKGLYYPNMSYYIYVSLINILLQKKNHKKRKTIHLAYKYILKNKELENQPGILGLNEFENIFSNNNEESTFNIVKIEQELICNIIKKLYIEIMQKKIEIYEVYKQLMNTKNNTLVNNNNNINCLGVDNEGKGTNFAGKYLMRYRDQISNSEIINKIENIENLKGLFQDKKLNDWIYIKIQDVCLIISVFILYLETNIDSFLINKILIQLYKPCFELKNEYDNTMPFNLKIEINNIFQNKLIELYQTNKWNYIKNIKNIELSSESINIIWNYISILIYNIMNTSKKYNINPIDLIKTSQNNLFKYNTDIKQAIINIIFQFENIIEKPVEINEIFVYSIYIILIGQIRELNSESNKIIFTKKDLQNLYITGNSQLLNQLYNNIDNYIVSNLDIKNMDNIKITNRIHFFSLLDNIKIDNQEDNQEKQLKDLVSKIFEGEYDEEDIQDDEDDIQEIINIIDDDDQIDDDEIL